MARTTGPNDGPAERLAMSGPNQLRWPVPPTQNYPMESTSGVLMEELVGGLIRKFGSIAEYGPRLLPTSELSEAKSGQCVGRPMCELRARSADSPQAC